MILLNEFKASLGTFMFTEKWSAVVGNDCGNKFRHIDVK